MNLMKLNDYNQFLFLFSGPLSLSEDASSGRLGGFHKLENCAQ
tara:strand:- start:13003 stop:13131 length:129 start_codon:yes stop_codon:yes gene_type:complete